MKKRSSEITIKNLSTWRKLILERDKYQCQECGMPHKDYFSIPKKLRPKMEAHHIIAIYKAPHLIFEMANGITLCRFCHRAKHAKKEKDE